MLEDLHRDAVDVSAPRPYGAGREAPVGDSPHGPVPRRIEEHEDVRRRHHGCVRSAQGDALPAREALRLGGDLLNISMLRDRPERGVSRRREVRDGRLGPQPPPQVVRIPALRVPLRVDEVEGVDVGRVGSELAGFGVHLLRFGVPDYDVNIKNW